LILRLICFSAHRADATFLPISIICKYRLIRTTPESRNEILAAAFRRYNICEERGSGFEKAVIAIELFGLPPLKFEETENAFKVTMYSPRKFADMTNTERIEACYQHSIIEYYGKGGFNNTSLRKRLGMNDKQAAQISKLINRSGISMMF